MKQRGEKIAMLTSYDYSMAKIVDAAGVDVILVGDSAANVMAGYETTLPITLDMMIYHARSVVRAVSRALVVVDLPFGSYQAIRRWRLDSAIRIMKETEADAIKIEGGEEILESVQRILSAGIPVMGHLGLTPQSIHKFGTYAVRAEEEAEAEKLVRDARLLSDAGCFGIVLEKIPAALADRVTKEISAPTIGIGAGGGCDGQVLVIHDMLGINKGFSAPVPAPLRRSAQRDDRRRGTVCPRREGVRFPQREGAVLILRPEKKSCILRLGMQLFSWDTGVLPPDDYVVRVGRVTVGGRLVECVETLVLDPLNGSLAVARRSASWSGSVRRRGRCPSPCGLSRRRPARRRRAGFSSPPCCRFRARCRPIESSLRPSTESVFTCCRFRCRAFVAGAVRTRIPPVSHIPSWRAAICCVPIVFIVVNPLNCSGCGCRRPDRDT